MVTLRFYNCVLRGVTVTQSHIGDKGGGGVQIWDFLVTSFMEGSLVALKFVLLASQDKNTLLSTNTELRFLCSECFFRGISSERPSMYPVWFCLFFVFFSDFPGNFLFFFLKFSVFSCLKNRDYSGCGWIHEDGKRYLGYLYFLPRSITR